MRAGLAGGGAPNIPDTGPARCVSTSADWYKATLDIKRPSWQHEIKTILGFWGNFPGRQFMGVVLAGEITADIGNDPAPQAIAPK